MHESPLNLEKLANKAFRLAEVEYKDVGAVLYFNHKASAASK